MLIIEDIVHESFLKRFAKDCLALQVQSVISHQPRFLRLSGDEDNWWLVVCHGGHQWQLCPCAKGPGSQWKLLPFLRRANYEQICTCTHFPVATNEIKTQLQSFFLSQFPTGREIAFLTAFDPWSAGLGKENDPIVWKLHVEARSHFSHGLTNHAFAAGLRAILQVATQFVLLLFSAKMLH